LIRLVMISCEGLPARDFSDRRHSVSSSSVRARPGSGSGTNVSNDFAIVRIERLRHRSNMCTSGAVPQGVESRVPPHEPQDEVGVLIL
jgi:hypothetical protein